MQTINKEESLAGKYKNIFIRSKNLIVSPKQEWLLIYQEKSDLNSILSSYNLPYIGALAFISFLSILTAHQGHSFELALKHGISQFSSFFFGLFICYFITYKIIPQFVLKPNGKNIKLLAFKLTAYSSIFLYLVKISTYLIPQIYYLQAIGIYVAYLVWKGTKNIGEFESKDLRVVFTIIVTTLLLFIPYVISYFLMRFTGISF
ncbi:DUF1282 domain-containing protein [Labilibacter sediminis]|nr:DUF1282 domain-containing protein [Labilibacter sediminis]